MPKIPLATKYLRYTHSGVSLEVLFLQLVPVIMVDQNNVQSKLEGENYELQMLVEMIYDSSYPESQVSTTTVLSPF